MKGWITIVLCFLSIGVFAQQANFYAAVNKNAIAKDGMVQLDIVIENGDMQSYVPPAFKDFNVLRSTQGQSTNITISGNQQVMVRTITRSYLLQPRKTGQLTIEPAAVRIDGQLLQTEPITITVTASGTTATPAPNNNNLPRENIFVRATLNSNNAYVGEQVLLSYKLYTRQNITSYNEPATTYAGFWKEDIAIKNPAVTREVINGIAYRTAIIKQVILFPQQSGELTIPAADMTADIEYGFFSSRRINLTTNAVTLTVKPLPDNAPSSFTGTVGSLKMTSSISQDSAAVDEPITLRIKLNGALNFDLLSDPEVVLPNAFEVYDPKVAINTSKQGGVLSGEQSYEYLIIPRQPGTYKLDPISFGYFNPKSATYETLTTPAYTFTITGESTGTQGAVSGISKEDIELLGEDIRYIKPKANWVKGNGILLGTPLFWLLSAGPITVWLLWFIWLRWRNNQTHDPIATKKKKALATAKKQLRVARQAIGKDNNQLFFDHIRLALWYYARDCFVIPAHELSKERITKALQEAAVDAAVISQLHHVLDTCDMALYAPVGGGAAQEQLVAEAESVIQSIQMAAQS